jgi:hypothetical protein
MPGSSAPTFDADEQVRLQLECLPGPAHLRVVAICVQRPLARNAAVIERRLADEVDLHHPVDARGRPHEGVVGILVGGWAGVGRDGIFAAARPHRQGVTDD